MARAVRNEYEPDDVLPPGVTLKETLDLLGLTQEELAARANRPYKTINEIVHGKSAITPETAIQLERVLGVPARFWNNLERHYREYRARLADEEQLERHAAWVDGLPWKQMVTRGWVQSAATPADQVRSLLSFFGIATPRPWRELCPPAAYRNSNAFVSEPASVAAWLRRGEILARGIPTEPFSHPGLRAALGPLRKLTLVEDPLQFVPQMQRICAECGVAVVTVPELPGTRLCGAARWLSPDRSLIELSARYKTNDNLWFTFFHEVGHVLLHGKRDFFVDASDGAQDEKEGEANRFATELLLPQAEYLAFTGSGVRTEAAVRAFAERVGVAPGIVVGRLQHDGLLPWQSPLNGLKVRYRFAA